MGVKRRSQIWQFEVRSLLRLFLVDSIVFAFLRNRFQACYFHTLHKIVAADPGRLGKTPLERSVSLSRMPPLQLVVHSNKVGKQLALEIRTGGKKPPVRGKTLRAAAGAADERLFPAAGPALDLGFASQGGGTAAVLLFPDQANRAARGGVLGGLAAVVLLEAAGRIGGDAGVERAIRAAQKVAKVHWE